jgi:endoglucanase
VTATPKPTVAPKPTVTPKPTATTKPNTNGKVTAAFKYDSAWATGYTAQVQVTSVTQTGKWQISWTDPAVTSIASSWGMKCTLAKTTITCAGDGWATNLTPGTTVGVGLQVNVKSPAVTKPLLTAVARA